MSWLLNHYIKHAEKIFILATYILDAVGALLLVKILTVNFDKTSVGDFYLFSSILTLGLSVSFSAFDQGYLRNLERYKKQGALYSNSMALRVGYMVLSPVLFYLICAVMIDGGDEKGAVLLLVYSWFVSEFLRNHIVATLNSLRERKRVFNLKAVEWTAKIVFLMVCVNAQLPFVFVFAVLSISTLAAVIPFQFKSLKNTFDLFRRCTTGVYKSSFQDAVSFSWPMVIWGGAAWLQNMYPRWLIAEEISQSTVAEYSVIISIFTFPFVAISSLVGMYLLPILYSIELSEFNSVKEHVEKWCRRVFVIGLFVSLVLTSMSEVVVSFISSSDYIQNKIIIFAVVISICFFVSASILTYVGLYLGRTKNLLVLNVLPGLLMYFICHYFIAQYGFHGAIYAYVICNVCAALLYCLYYYLLVRSFKRSGVC